MAYCKALYHRTKPKDNIQLMKRFSCINVMRAEKQNLIVIKFLSVLIKWTPNILNSRYFHSEQSTLAEIQNQQTSSFFFNKLTALSKENITMKCKFFNLFSLDILFGAKLFLKRQKNLKKIIPMKWYLLSVNYYVNNSLVSLSATENDDLFRMM